MERQNASKVHGQIQFSADHTSNLTTRAASDDRPPIAPLDKRISYPNWARRITEELKGQGIWYVIDEPIQNQKSWYADNATAKAFILKNVGRRLNYGAFAIARVVWDVIRTDFSCHFCGTHPKQFPSGVVSIHTLTHSSLECLYCRLLLEAIRRLYPS